MYAKEHKLEKQREATARWRESHKEQERVSRMNRYQENAEELRAKRREYYEEHKEECAASQKKWYEEQKQNDPSFMQHRRDLRNKYVHERRSKVLAYYGGKCACCSETEPKFLGLDHINNDGQQHRKRRGSEFYQQVIDEGYPDFLQILCHNCNLARGFYGICPHQEAKR